jgi:hypothetical protein
MGEMENQAELFYERLGTSVNPGKVLLELFQETINRSAGKSEIIIINRLIKLFGRFTVFFAIMDLSKYEEGKLTDNLYPLLYTICRNRFERIHSDTFNPAHESLDKEINQLDKDAEKTKKAAKKMNVPSPDGLKN